MLNNHRDFTEDLLFNYYMISSLGENQVFCPVPFYIDKISFEQMKYYSNILNSLSLKVIKGINKEHKNFINYMDDFKYKKEIFSLTCPITPIFWTRYDAFKRENGGVFFSEFNYDKPCAQREILASSRFNIKNNPNTSFLEQFKQKFIQILGEKFKDKKKTTIGILIDPCHYEELHLSHLFIDLLNHKNLELIPVGPKNFSVHNNKVYALKKQIDVILRLYPTEFLYEVTDFDKILDLFDRGNLLIINDPRVIICQAKSLFAYLWELVIKQSNLLTSDEVEAIKASLPYTRMFNRECFKIQFFDHAKSLDDFGRNTENFNICNLKTIPNRDLKEELLNSKDKYVIKSVLGRYSNEVYIGTLCTKEEWIDIIDKISESSKLHIIQNFCAIHKEFTYKVNEFDLNYPTEAFPNFGIYLIDGNYAGSCIRWSNDYLTLDDSTWITPIGVVNESLKIEDFCKADRKKTWQEIYEKSMLQYGFTGGYSREYEYFSLQSIVLTESLENEIRFASEAIASIFSKIQKLVINNAEVFVPILGIPDDLLPLIKNCPTEALCCIGRMDWVLTTEGNLKLLEFNSETPAGILEAINLTKLIKETLNIPYKNPSENLALSLKNNISKIIEDYKRTKDIKNIGFLTSTYYEDWYTTNIILDIVKELPYNFVIGNIYDIKVKNDKLYLYDTPLDAVYRYYPLDWFYNDNNLKNKNFIEAFKYNTLSLNPPTTIISQNKAIFALMYELMTQGFFNKQEQDLIKKYIPFTTLSAEKISTSSFCVKPFLGREGEGINFSYDLEDIPKGDYIYQELIHIKPVDIDIYSTLECKKDIRFPVIGSFLVDSKFSGIYTRCGNIITDSWASFLPTYTNMKINTK